MQAVLEDPRPTRLALEPLDDFVVVEYAEEEAETRAGLILYAQETAIPALEEMLAAGSEDSSTATTEPSETAPGRAGDAG